MRPSVIAVTDKFAPHAGGTAVVWTEYCRRWPLEAVRVITRRFPGSTAIDRQEPYRIQRVPYLDVPKLRMPLLWAGLFGRTLRECVRQRPDVLHCGQILETGLYAPWLKRRFGIPYCVHVYGEELSAYARRPRTRRWMQRVLEGASGIAANSRFTQGLLHDAVGYTGPSLLTPPGVDADRFVPGDAAAARAHLGLGDGLVLLTVARLMRRKGHDRVLEVLPRLRRRFPDVQYLIAGTGPEEVRLRRLAAELGVEASVRFLGRVSDADLVPLFQAADVFVHPNRQTETGDVEGFGIVFLEANACGVPVVGGRSGGTVDAIRHGETGFLIDPDSSDELADTLTALLSDPALRQRLGRAGREWAATFTWERSAGLVWNLTRQVAGQDVKPPPCGLLRP